MPKKLRSARALGVVQLLGPATVLLLLASGGAWSWRWVVIALAIGVPATWWVWWSIRCDLCERAIAVGNGYGYNSGPIQLCERCIHRLNDSTDRPAQ
jgi:hypothetical protein